MMMRFYDPTSGGIYLDGKDLRTLNPTSFRSHIGIVSQVSRGEREQGERNRSEREKERKRER
jgi:hypothetical protein